MNLPIPKDEAVAQFALMYERKYGIRLTREEATDAATRVLQLYYIGTYGLLALEREKKAADAGPHPAEPPRKRRRYHRRPSSGGKQ